MRRVPRTHDDRVLGCLLGGAVGDALGAAVEFDSLDKIRSGHGHAGVTGYVEAYGGIGTVTDDTQMTLLTVAGIHRALVTGQPVNETVHSLYRDWARGQVLGHWPDDADPWLTQHPVLLARRAPGDACLSGLTTGFMATKDRKVNEGSKGCGTVMRSAPFGLVPSWSPKESFDHAVDCSLLSHGHDVASASAGALAMMVRLLLEGVAVQESAEKTLDYLLTRTDIDTTETVDAIQAGLDAAELVEPAPEAVEALGGGWVAEEALAIALYCALVHEDDAMKGLLLAVNHSGDSDSTGSVCGNLLGAAYGIDVLPTEWVEGNEARDLVIECAPSVLVKVSEPPRSC